MSNNTTSDNKERFALLEPALGSGGFATTYRARVLDKFLAKKYDTDIVVLKIPHDREKEAWLQEEAEINAYTKVIGDAKISNLVHYFGFSTFKNQSVLVMEYVADGSLRKFLGKFGLRNPLPIDRAFDITEGILKGLIVLHERHIYHRDIKPENILLDGNIPKLADFGLSRYLEKPDMHASQPRGTYHYMSPESLQTGGSFSSDLWSVGVTLYEMVSRQLPFGNRNSENVRKLINEICEIEPEPPNHIRPDLPQSLNDFILRSLCKDPKDRFPSAQDMLKSLLSIKNHLVDENLERELAEVRNWSVDIERAPDIEKKLKNLLINCPQSSKIYQYLGEFYNLRQAYQEAIATFRKGIEFNPDNALLHWDLALALQNRGDKKNAAHHLRQAIELGLDTGNIRHAQSLLKTLEGG